MIFESYSQLLLCASSQWALMWTLTQSSVCLFICFHIFLCYQNVRYSVWCLLHSVVCLRLLFGFFVLRTFSNIDSQLQCFFSVSLFHSEFNVCVCEYRSECNMSWARRRENVFVVTQKPLYCVAVSISLTLTSFSGCCVRVVFFSLAAEIFISNSFSVLVSAHKSKYSLLRRHTPEVCCGVSSFGAPVLRSDRIPCFSSIQLELPLSVLFVQLFVSLVFVSVVRLNWDCRHPKAFKHFDRIRLNRQGVGGVKRNQRTNRIRDVPMKCVILFYWIEFIRINNRRQRLRFYRYLAHWEEKFLLVLFCCDCEVSANSM